MIHNVVRISILKRYSMPAAPRWNKKATKIAWDILGKPANMQFKPSKEERRIDRRLLFEETTRVR